MPPWVIDIVLLVLTLGMTYALLSEGLWGAALMFFNVLFAGLITFNFYEPLAAVIAENATFMADYADMVCILAIFGITLLALRLTTDSIAPGMVRFPSALYWLGGLLFGLAASAMTMGILLLALHAAPVHKKMFGKIDYRSSPPFGLGLDHKWLAFFQQSSGVPFARYSEEYPPDPFRHFGGGTAGLNLFDPRGDWLIKHQEARPYGEGAIGGSGEGGSLGGTQASGGQGGGLGIPGGTAGAAAGLAPTFP
ncbi:MAG: CvpA family protein [Isosphaeraceae bacterium]